ncbi:activating signal cointegrator 1 complex subunit [Balamuthia mandrillaris]
MEDYSHEEGITLVTVHGRTFRKAKVDRPLSSTRRRRVSAPSSTSTTANKKQAEEEPRFEQDEPVCSALPPSANLIEEEQMMVDTAEGEEDALPIEQEPDSGLCVLRLPLAPAFYPFLIGKGGQMRSKLQSDTGTTLLIPRQGAAPHQQQVVIRGPSRQAVRSAHSRIEILCQQALERLPYTHFLSIPLTTDAELLQGVRQFCRQLLQEEQQGQRRGLEESILVDPAKLHLTLLMLKLYSEREVERAKELLRGCAAAVYDVVGTTSLRVALTGLEMMNDDPSRVDVVYMGVKELQEPPRLPAVCKYLQKEFSKAGLISEAEMRPVKLHATLINTRLRTQAEDGGEEESTSSRQQQRGGRGGAGRGGSRDQEERIPIDATQLLSRHSSRSFGEIKLSGIHLSQRGKFDASGYYHSITSISFP